LEFFNHERNAFTGADADRENVFEQCHRGTIFLDEVSELPRELQTRLLRMLDQRTIRRVGSNVQRRVDVRIVAATNRTLLDDVHAGSFREDLYYRLAVVRIVLPPLRARRDDIPDLARHFLTQAGCADLDAVLTPQVLEALASRRWPGNVRELRNVLERAVVLSHGAAELVEDQPPGPERIERPPESNEDRTAESAEAKGEIVEQEEAVSAPRLGGWLARALPPQLYQLPYKELKKMLVEELENLYIDRLLRRCGRNIARIAEQGQVDRHLVRKVLQRLEHKK